MKNWVFDKRNEKKHCEAAINRSKWWKIVAREWWHLTMHFSKSTPLQLQGPVQKENPGEEHS
jgi:hypothetical protein